MAYRSLVESILSFNITAWYGNLSVKNKNKLSKIVNIAEKVIGKSQKQLCNIFDSAVLRKAKHITADTSLTPSGAKSGYALYAAHRGAAPGGRQSDGFKKYNVWGIFYM